MDCSLAAMTVLAYPQRRDQFRRVILQHLDIFLPARRRQQCDAFLTWHHVHVEVEHDLSAGGLVELLHGDAVGVERFHRGGCDLVGGAGDMGVIVGGDVEDIAGRGLWDHQRVAG